MDQRRSFRCALSTQTLRSSPTSIDPFLLFLFRSYFSFSCRSSSDSRDLRLLRVDSLGPPLESLFAAPPWLSTWPSFFDLLGLLSSFSLFCRVVLELLWFFAGLAPVEFRISVDLFPLPLLEVPLAPATSREFDRSVAPCTFLSLFSCTFSVAEGSSLRSLSRFGKRSASS